jgi:hypothetical protein
MNRRHAILVGILVLILLTSLVTFLALILRPVSSEHSSNSSNYNIKNINSLIDDGISSVNDNLDSNSLGTAEDSLSSVTAEEDDSYDYESEKSSKESSNNLDLKEVSRLSWNLLNSNQERISGSSGSSGGSTSSHRHKPNNNNNNSPLMSPASFSSISGEGQELVLPSKMIFTSGGGNKGDEESDSNSDPNASPDKSGNSKTKSCCRTQKYSQVIKKEGCEPLTITNRMCFGQCVSVWVPGLFASFPVCRPSRSSWKTVTLTCGKNSDRKRRVRIEKVRRCSCMEIEGTNHQTGPSGMGIPRPGIAR